MYLRVRDINYYQKKKSRNEKTFLRTFLFAIIVLLAVIFSSLSEAKSAPTELIDSLNSNHVIYFDFGQYDLKQDSYNLLDRLAERLKYNSNAKIEITGHTDNIGSETFNNELSIKRAETVKLYLISHGVNTYQVITEGKGFKIPASENTTDESRAMNRRVEFRWILLPVAEKTETDESFANTGLWKSTREELKGELSVRDTAGEPITGIEEKDVSATLKWKQNGNEDSTDGTVKLFPIDDKKKLAITFTMDYSGSMFGDSATRFPKKSEKVIQMEKAVLTFIDNMDQRFYGSIIKFGWVVSRLVRFTKSKFSLTDAVNNYTENLFGTALYRSIWIALKDTTYNSNPTIMKTVIAFTDGEENSSGNINKDSIYRYSDDRGIKVFTVGLIDIYKHSSPVGMNSIGEADLVEIAKRTGGFYYWAKDPAVLPLIYKQIYDQIMKSYNISILWNGDKLPLKGTAVTAVVRVNVKGTTRTIYKKYVME